MSLTYDDRNPATGAVIAQIPETSREELDAAVKTARKAFDGGKWSSMAASRRAKVINKMAALIAERSNELMMLEVRDNGKAVSTAKGEMGAIVDCFEFYAGAATKNYGESMPPPLPTYLANTVREPVGVVGAIIPWNFPLLLASWKVAPALAAGCTIVLKPAPTTPLTAIELGKIALEAGIPEGVLNIVTGSGRDLGQWLVEHPLVDKIAFTGSTATGKLVAKTAAETVKRVTLELGGKSPSVVFDDANLEAAVAGAIYGIFYNAGQACEARSRVPAPAKPQDLRARTRHNARTAWGLIWLNTPARLARPARAIFTESRPPSVRSSRLLGRLLSCAVTHLCRHARHQAGALTAGRRRAQQVVA